MSKAEILSIQLETNIEDITNCFNTDSSWKWRDALEEVIKINNVNNTIKFDSCSFILELEVYGNSLYLSINAIDDDPYTSAQNILKDKNNLQKLVDFSNKFIDEYNHVFNESSITHIPNAYIIYNGGNKFYVEIDIGQKSISFDYIIFTIKSEIDEYDFDELQNY